MRERGHRQGRGGGTRAPGTGAGGARGRLAVVAAGVAAFAVALAAVGGIRATSAAWTDDEVVTATARTTPLTPVPTVTCPASGLLGSLPLSWTAPAGTTPTEYRVTASTLPSGAVYQATVPATSTTYNIGTLLGLGTYRLEVYARYGTWESPVSLQSRTASLVAIGWTCS
jgi:hypothetical protein